jgi:hypothetical protein
MEKSRFLLVQDRAELDEIALDLLGLTAQMRAM